MMPDWLIALCIIWAWGLGFITAWAICHNNDPFWREFFRGLAIWPMFVKRRNHHG